MASIAGITITGSGSAGAFIDDRTVTLNAFKIAKHETTYELWYEVKTWAASNGYTFRSGYDGKEGNDGTLDAAPTEAKTEPVAGVDWFDAVIWCNAYSEITGKTPVYTVSGAVLKDVSAVTSDSSTWPALDALDITKNGYRLPTEAEWEAAARGGDPNAAAWAYTYAGSDTIADVAWYGNTGSTAESTTHQVGDKTANSAGLYDMTGNVYEWCWDWNSTISTTTPADGASSGTVRVWRGGWWHSNLSQLAVTYRGNCAPDNQYADLGFRVVCAQ